ncbi:flavin-containing monooxygenase FMO GS-OX-like 7 isoform X2 [Aristolochia californica]|uniref:flavin-containing monooxygenase FMO GS-OX-like 7 isoform X2 n=1 Tax=Aristolochia californica TaxID=171875 RepID=UPI0035DD7D0F
MGRSCKVAVIGAGAAGLVAARELVREGHQAVIFEKGDRVGGTWVYDPRTETDPLGLNPDREIIHSSLYRSLRTNLPRRIMGFSDYPFKVREKRGDSREFPGHEEVLWYLEDFATDFQLTEFTRFKTEVTRVRMGSRKDEWLVESRRLKTCSEFESESEVETEIFEAVVVCNGHFVEPKIAVIPGIEKWPGKQIHSHNYRIPEPFEDQIVVIIGSGPSALDISRDIAKVAKKVHLASRSPDVEVGKVDGLDNVWQNLMIECVNEDGLVIFEDGTSTFVDTILHCTGYKYYFPFLDINRIVTVDDNRVGPLYKHVFPPSLAPCLSFVGLPSKSYRPSG